MSDQTMTLRDGRLFAFAEWGDPEGKPLFLVSGASSRLLAPPSAPLLEHRVRAITIDKPGLGLSSEDPGHTLEDFAGDLVELADHLRLARFALLGGSQGGPFACAVAFFHPARLTTLTLVSALTPFEVRGLNRENGFFMRLLPVLANRAPRLLYLLYAGIHRMVRRDPAAFARRAFGNLPPGDQAILTQQGVADLFASDLSEVMRNGSRGAADDVRAVARPWGFSPSQIRVPTFLWQGESDPNVTPRMGRYLAESIPDCEATFVPGAGHFLFYTHWERIVAQLAGAQP